jgi:hypothetical protein
VLLELLAFVAKKLVAVALVVNNVVVVALVKTKLVPEIFVVLAFVAKSLVVVLLVVLALVAKRFVVVAVVLTRLVIVAEADVKSLIVPLVMVVVASVEVPTTVSVPCEVRDDVAVIEPPVSVLIVAVTAFNIEAKRFVEVLLIVTDDVAKRLVAEAFVEIKLANEPVVALNISTLNVCAKISLAVKSVAVVVARVVVPNTVNRPVVVAAPASMRKFGFSTQALPLQ